MGFQVCYLNVFILWFFKTCCKFQTIEASSKFEIKDFLVLVIRYCYSRHIYRIGELRNKWSLSFSNFAATDIWILDIGTLLANWQKCQDVQKKVPNFVHRSDRLVLSKRYVKIQVDCARKICEFLGYTCVNCLHKCDSKFDRDHGVPEKVNEFF